MKSERGALEKERASAGIFQQETCDRVHSNYVLLLLLHEHTYYYIDYSMTDCSYTRDVKINTRPAASHIV